MKAVRALRLLIEVIFLTTVSWCRPGWCCSGPSVAVAESTTETNNIFDHTLLQTKVDIDNRNSSITINNIASINNQYASFSLHRLSDHFPGPNYTFLSGWSTRVGIFNETAYFSTIAYDDNLESDSVQIWSFDGDDFLFLGVIATKIHQLSFLEVYRFVAYRGTIFFGFRKGSKGTDLWKTDGTFNSTSLVYTTGNEAGVADLVAFNDRLYFATRRDPYALFASDGTTENTGVFFSKEIFEIHQPMPGMQRLAFKVISRNETDRSDLTYETWLTDGTLQGTGPFLNSSIDRLSPSFNNGTYLVGLHKSGSQVDGTYPIMATNFQNSPVPLLADVSLFNSFLFNETHLMFTTRSSTLWLTDGTIKGTSQLLTFDSGRVSCIPTFDDNRIAVFHTDSSRTSLYTIDPTERGSFLVQFWDQVRLLTSLLLSDGRIFSILINETDSSRHTMVTDYTINGTYFVEELTFPFPGGDPGQLYNLKEGVVIFFPRDPMFEGIQSDGAPWIMRYTPRLKQQISNDTASNSTNVSTSLISEMQNSWMSSAPNESLKTNSPSPDPSISVTNDPNTTTLGVPFDPSSGFLAAGSASFAWSFLLTAACAFLVNSIVP